MSGRVIRPAAALAPALGIGAILLLLSAAGLLYTLLPLASDQAYYSYGAWRIAQGDVPYRDVGCYDAPGIYAVHLAAHSLFGWSQAGLRRFDVLWIAWALGILYAIGRHLKGPAAGWLAIAIAGLLYVGLGYRETAQREAFTLPFVLACILWHLRGGSGAMRDLGLGACAAAVFWLKPPVVLVCAPIFVAELWRARMQLRAMLQRVLGMGAGLALVSAPIGIYFLANDALQPLRECFVDYSAVYASIRYPAPTLARLLLRMVGLSSITGVAVYALVAMRGVAGMPVLAASVAGAIASAALQGKLAIVHLIPVWFLLSLAAAIGIVDLCRAAADATLMRRRLRRFVGVVVAIAILAELGWIYSRGQYPRLIGGMLAGKSLEMRHEDYKVGRYLAAHTRPNDPILVWGVSAGLIYFVARRPTPSRLLQVYIFTSPLRDTALAQRWKAEYLQSVMASRPRYIVVLGRDAWPGIQNYDSEIALAEWPELSAWIAANYREETVLQGRVRYRLLALVDPPPRVAPDG